MNDVSTPYSRPQKKRTPRLGFFGFCVLAKFAVLVPLTANALTRLGYKRTMIRIPTSQLKRWLPSTKDDLRILTGCAQAMHIVGKHSPFPGTCLARAMVLHSTLSRYGLSSALRLGVKRTVGDQLSAHAWVEVAGQPVNEPPDITQVYTAFSETDFLTLLDNAQITVF